jgi:hypothetical protein
MMGPSEESGNSAMVKGTEANTDSVSNPNNPADDIQIFQTPENNGDISTAQSTEPFEGTGKPLYEPGTIEEAKVYMGEEFRMPQYIPSGFNQSLVQVPTDMSKEGMDIMINYEGDNKFFTLTMRKGATALDNFIGSKEIDINGIKARVTSGALMAESEEIAPIYTQMRWINNNMLFIIEGQIAEEEAVKVARSIKQVR